MATTTHGRDDRTEVNGGQTNTAGAPALWHLDAFARAPPPPPPPHSPLLPAPPAAMTPCTPPLCPPRHAAAVTHTEPRVAVHPPSAPAPTPPPHSAPPPPRAHPPPVGTASRSAGRSPSAAAAAGAATDSRCGSRVRPCRFRVRRPTAGTGHWLNAAPTLERSPAGRCGGSGGGGGGSVVSERRWPRHQLSRRRQGWREMGGNGSTPTRRAATHSSTGQRGKARVHAARCSWDVDRSCR